MPLDFGMAQHDGYKTPSEDYVIHIIYPNNYELFAVFDGHNTDYYSKEASRILPEILHQEFQQERSIDEILTVLQAAFIDTDIILANGPKYGGTTATVTIVTDKHIITASLGDSQALYFDNEGNLLYKTNDHNTGNQEECDRILEYGGRILKDSDGELRINGELSLTRSIGDKTYKDCGVICIPEISVHKRHTGYIALLSDSFTEKKTYSFLLEIIIINKYKIEDLSNFIFSFIEPNLLKAAQNAVLKQVNKFNSFFFGYYGDNTSLIYIKV